MGIPASSPGVGASANSAGAETGQAGQQQPQPIPVTALDEEYDLVQQAFATDSEDQV